MVSEDGVERDGEGTAAFRRLADLFGGSAIDHIAGMDDEFRIMIQRSPAEGGENFPGLFRVFPLHGKTLVVRVFEMDVGSEDEFHFPVPS